jgi:DNA end-binding protein Ku
MEDRQRVGIGKVVMREKQYLAAVRPYGKGLALSTMLFADEVVPQSDIDDIPTRKASVGDREKKMAREIVDSLAREWDPKRYHDDYEEQLRDVIKAKSKGKQIEAPEPEKSADVLDLMDALRASLDSGRRGAKRSAPRAAKKAARKTAKKATRKSPRKRATKARASA